MEIRDEDPIKVAQTVGKILKSVAAIKKAHDSIKSKCGGGGGDSGGGGYGKYKEHDMDNYRADNAESIDDDLTQAHTKKSNKKYSHHKSGVQSLAKNDKLVNKKITTQEERKRLTNLQRCNLAYKQKYKCAVCKCMLPPMWDADHITPLHIKIDNRLENYQALCAACHALKTNQENLDAIEKMQTQQQPQQPQQKQAKNTQLHERKKRKHSNTQ